MGEGLPQFTQNACCWRGRIIMLCLPFQGFWLCTKHDKLEKSHGKALRNISELRSRGCTIFHDSDVRKLAQYPELRKHK